ncbi:quinol dehydrogenase membrane component [Mariprofundus micogutta]|uniref:Quinol dehydrogenase membrane component n=1 Tax=Mariprofundus micogutta TaxID=1921010 RepID=A0A1L8CK27_9PROT|nr:cytochrome c oxidase accessory protein CcoG [Mariprofundus micogutta]GAV19263.1 quinol dehydrogenase membrane component [Mariprofundus micogutta]
MSQNRKSADSLEDLYADTLHYHVNTGGETIHAKRMPGRFRNLKWLTMSTWLAFFIGPYLQWGDHQAILFDIPGRKFHLFGATIWPQDIWMLSLLLILLAITLFGVTAVAGRVFCGYFCFQTVWTDVFTWIEDKIEGNAIQRRRLDKAAWSADKIRKKTLKHSLWLLVSILTGITFAAYFTDAFELWNGYLTFSAPYIAWVVLALFIAGTYILAGFMREQVCFWLCPYARIQSVMVDKDSILPTYDYHRGEPRGKVKSKSSDAATKGDCIDCKMCVGVCPTGVDIREGLSEGCITCGLCIDACDSIMDKVGKPKGLIRYLSHKEMDGVTLPPVFKRPRVITYSTIFMLAVTGIIYGLATIPPVELSIVHSRQPLFMRMSDGSIQNKYTIKAVNKLETDQRVSLTVKSSSGDVHMVKEAYFKDITLKAGKMVPFSIFLQATPASLEHENTDVQLTIQGITQPDITVTYDSVFVGPKK